MNEDLKLMIKKAWIFTGIIFIFGLATLSKALFIGMTFGCIVSIIAFYSIIKTARVSVNLSSSKKATNYTRLSYLKRYAMYGLALFLMMKLDYSYFIACALGLLNIKIVIFSSQVSKFIINLKNKFKERRERN